MPSRFWRLWCSLIRHEPALVTSPTRCLHCGQMIEWDDRGDWRRHYEKGRAMVDAEDLSDRDWRTTFR